MPQHVPDQDERHFPDQKFQHQLAALLGRENFPWSATAANGDCGVAAPLQTLFIERGYSPMEAEAMAKMEMPYLRRTAANLLRPPGPMDSIYRAVQCTGADGQLATNLPMRTNAEPKVKIIDQNHLARLLECPAGEGETCPVLRLGARGAVSNCSASMLQPIAYDLARPMPHDDCSHAGGGWVGSVHMRALAVVLCTPIVTLDKTDNRIMTIYPASPSLHHRIPEWEPLKEKVPLLQDQNDPELSTHIRSSGVGRGTMTAFDVAFESGTIVLIHDHGHFYPTRVINRSTHNPEALKTAFRAAGHKIFSLRKIG